MSTGACGINCDACGLSLRGICTTCGPGNSREAIEKLAAQERLLGSPCPILECAVREGIAYCSRDCDRFPCHAFRTGPYPFSRGYLDMQRRRRRENPSARTPSGGAVEVPAEYWEMLEKGDIKKICRNSLANDHPSTGLLLPFMNEYLLVDRQGRRLCRQAHGRWDSVDNSLLELVCLLYLLNAGPESPGDQLITEKELKCSHFFRPPHELKVEPVARRYGSDLEGFCRAAELAGGEAADMADEAYRFSVFPKVPVYYLIWEEDEEFEARVSVLFDRSIESHLAADAIWGLVNLVSGMLLTPGGGTRGRERAH
jgi:uncharacterized protein DUF3786